MRQAMVGDGSREQRPGIVTALTCMMIATLVILTGAGLGRSITDLRAAQGYAAQQQAYYLAEAAVDESMALVRQGASERVTR